ncbi:hypothetical protein MMC29_007218 [Sticta canariensis]|nr:hypothetical protein [Sticta canariensis]
MSLMLVMLEAVNTFSDRSPSPRASSSSRQVVVSIISLVMARLGFGLGLKERFEGAQTPGSTRIASQGERVFNRGGRQGEKRGGGWNRGKGNGGGSENVKGSVGHFSEANVDLVKIVITHPALLDCLTVDIYVGDLYNFISGSGGTRAVPFFQSLSNSSYRQTLATVLLRIRSSLWWLPLGRSLRRAQKALSHEGLLALVETIQQISATFDLDKCSLAVHTVAMRVAELQRMIRSAHGLLVKYTNTGDEDALKPRHVMTSTYPRDIQLLGDRHDNDRRDITEISIVPTIGELRSDRVEFLLSSSLDLPHFLDEVERLFDTHFRLLRHNIFGAIKSFLGEVLNAHEKNPDSTRNFDLNPGNLCAYAYDGASVEFLKFTKSRVLEARISFLQSHHLQKKSSSERRRWWEQPGRLDEGSLLCHLSLKTQAVPSSSLPGAKRTSIPMSFSVSPPEVVMQLLRRNLCLDMMEPNGNLL